MATVVIEVKGVFEEAIEDGSVNKLLEKPVG